MTEKRLLGRPVIQIFNRYLEPGGEEAWVTNLEKSLDLPTCYFDSSDWTGPNAPPFWSQAIRMIYNPKSLRKLRQYHERENAQAWIVHNVFPTGSAGIYREAQRNRIPLIQYIHSFRPLAVSGYLNTSDLPNFPKRLRTHLTEIKRGSWQNSRVKTAWFATVLTIAHLLRWFDAVTAWIAVSDFMREQFIRAGVPAEEIFTLRHFWRPHAEVQPDTDGDYYIYLGRLVEMKGVLALLDAWDLIRQAKGSNGPKLVICGDGPLREKVRTVAAANPLVDFKGPVHGQAKLEILRGARAIIAPSLCLESLGLVAYEAYDFAKPVLAARAGGLGEIVLHGLTGLIHEPGDIKQIVNDVLRIEQDPVSGIEMGKKGRQWLAANAGEQEWKKRFATVVEFAVARRKH